MVGISLNDARTIIIATAKKGQEMGMKPLSTIVLDAGGHVKLLNVKMVRLLVDLRLLKGRLTAL